MGAGERARGVRAEGRGAEGRSGQEEVGLTAPAGCVRDIVICLKASG